MVLSFAFLIIIGTILLVLPVSSESGRSLSFIDSLFTATSAVCVTGLIVVDTPNTFTTFGEVVILLLIQVGGIGIITAGTILLVLMGQQISLRNRLILKESLAAKGHKQLVMLVSSVIKFTLAIELIGAVVLSFLFMRDFGPIKSVYLGIFHSVSAFCNAGFSLFSNSLMRFVDDWPVNLTFMVLIILGGLGFPVLSELRSFKKGKTLSIRARIVLITTTALILAGAFLIHIFTSMHTDESYNQLSPIGKFLTCMFQSVTARTAGFNTVDLNIFPDVAIVVIILLMFIGGSPQSTAGGIKTTTFWIILVSAWSYLKGDDSIRIWHKQIHPETFRRAVVLAIMAFLLVMLASALLIYYNSSEKNQLKLLFETVSAFATVGLTMGSTSGLNTMQKLILILMMFIGRIGPISFAFFFVTRKKKSMIEYPDVDIPTG
jgi:trk system potassium uptake protein TrkH